MPQGPERPRPEQPEKVRVTCPHCSGSGKDDNNKKCSHCNGSGYMWVIAQEQ